MESILSMLKEHFKNTPKEEIQSQWNNLAEYDNVGMKACDFIKLALKNKEPTKTIKYDKCPYCNKNDKMIEVKCCGECASEY